MQTKSVATAKKEDTIWRVAAEGMSFTVWRCCTVPLSPFLLKEGQAHFDPVLLQTFFNIEQIFEKTTRTWRVRK